LTILDIEAPALHASGEQEKTPKKTLAEQQAQQQLARWMREETALGMIYARPLHETSVWAQVTISALLSHRLMCQSEHMNFMLMIEGATFSVESLQYWVEPMQKKNAMRVEGLQIWCANGDWLFLTEQIAHSRSMSLQQLVSF
jgi:uncharacterized membrane protein